MQVGVTVSPSCDVSTENATRGAVLGGGCPDYTRQSLVRELSVGSELRATTGSAVSEQLVLVINF